MRRSQAVFNRHFQVWPEGLPHHLTLPQTSLQTNLEVSARRYPDHDAIIYYDSRLTYGRLHSEVEALAGYLRSLGVERGERVLMDMQNAPQFVIGHYAILRADAVAVPINPMNRTAELRHYVNDTGARVMLCAQEVYPFVEPLLDEGAVSRVIVAAYGDYITETTDLPLPEEVSAPRWDIPPRRRHAVDGCAGVGRHCPGVGRHPGRPGGVRLQLGHHRRAQGLRAHPPLGDGAQRRGKLLDPLHAGRREPGDPAVLPRHRDADRYERLHIRRLHHGYHDPLGPPHGRRVDPALPGYGVA
jgi:hypothetical protein